MCIDEINMPKMANVKMRRGEWPHAIPFWKTWQERLGSGGRSGNKREEKSSAVSVRRHRSGKLGLIRAEEPGRIIKSEGKLSPW